MLANVFLHQVLDAWVVQDVQPRRQGRGFLTRFADDCIIGCELEADARRGMAVLPKRCNRFRSDYASRKDGVDWRARSRHVESHRQGGQGSVDLLGFTPYGAKTRRGYWAIKRKTVGKRLRRCMKAIGIWCRENRHEPLQEQYRT